MGRKKKFKDLHRPYETCKIDWKRSGFNARFQFSGGKTDLFNVPPHLDSGGAKSIWKSPCWWI